MLVDDSKIFLYGLPPDCQEDTLKDFLEAVYDNPGAVTKVSIPDKKTYAFVTLSCTEVTKHLLGNTLLYCDGVGQLYQVKACPYIKQPFRKKKIQDYKPKTKPNATSMEITEPKAVKYKPPDHVHQCTPDYSMLSHSKPKRRKRKRDDLAVWLGDVGSTSFRKRPRQNKKKKKVSKLELHKTESFQFGNLCPESTAITTNMEDTTNTTGAVEPAVHENGQRLSKAIITNIEATTNTRGPVEPVLHENGQRLNKAMTTNVKKTSNTTGPVEPIEGKIPAVEVVSADDQKTSSTISSHTQVIIDHDYLGPLCLQFTSPPSVADVKNELMERTGLPVKDQLLYCNGKKLSDSHDLRPMIDYNQDSLTLVLSVGTLKGGVRPKKAPDEGAVGGEDPSSSQLQDEGATGGEMYSSALKEDAVTSMETWNVERTAEWFRRIGLDKKYASICQKEGICGRALLLLAGRSPDQLVSVLQLKRGPQCILLDNLQPHLDAFDQDKPQTPQISSKIINEWTVEELYNWLSEVGVPEESLSEVQEEEINGQAFLVLKNLNDLKECLKLKAGPWIVLEHELFLHLEKTGNIKSETTPAISATEETQLMSKHDESIVETKEMDETKEPLAANDPSIPMVASSKREEKLSLVQNALKLDMEASKGSENIKECLIRSVFVKRGKGANALEKLFNFIVITKDEMKDDKPRKLWSKIIETTEEWIKLLPKKDCHSFHWDVCSDSFVHVPTGKKVSFVDGKVGQIFLEKLSESEYKQSVFVVLVDNQLLGKTKQYNVSLDKFNKVCYSIRLDAKESKYHASFNPNNPGQGLKWSKHFKSLTSNACNLMKNPADPPQSDPKPPLPRDAPLQTPRPFNSEFENKYYSEGFVFPYLETGAKDLIKPAHELKLFRTDLSNSDEDGIKKFVYETLRFACGCLNERTNGTIHFGVADELEGQTCDYKPREIVGSWVTNKPRYNEKLTEFIDKCFVGDSRSNVHNCIRPPVFIPVKGTDAELPSHDRVVIEVDIEPSYSLCAGEIFKAGFKSLGRGKEEAVAYIRRGSKTQAIVDVPGMEDYLKNRLPKLDEERKKREQEQDHVIQGMEKQDSVKHLNGKLTRLLCANKKVLDTSVYPILVLSKPGVSMNQEFLDKTFRFIKKIKWQVIIDFDDQGSDSKGLCNVFKSGPVSSQCDMHEAEDYDDNEDLIEDLYRKTHWLFGNGYAKLGKEAVGFKQWNNSKRKGGLNLVIRSLTKTLPRGRAVVLFLLFSEESEPMADTFKEFCTGLRGPNQLVYAAENSEIVSDWVAKLSSTCLEEHELRERGVVGMSWSEFQECLLQMVSGIDRHQHYVTMATGTPYPLGNITFNNIDIVSAKECEELRDLSSEDRLEISSEAEIEFYRGYPVTWKNFWFTENHLKIHVLLRDNYSDLKALIEKLHSRGSEGKVQTITIYHHIGAGASTMSRQALWDFRCDSKFPYRCAVITKIDDSTCREILRLRNVGYGEESEVSLPPVLALVEVTDDFLFWELRSQVMEHAASKLQKTEWPVCVFIYCKPTQTPRECYLKEKGTSVFLEQHLSQKEVDWFKDKYTEMKRSYDDPERDFETYANENLISFMIMKENFNPSYASSIVQRNLSLVTDDELTLLQYTSLLNIYNPYPVFTSCFDTIMLSDSFLRRKMVRHWVDDLTHSARIFLREIDCSTHLGTGKAIAVVHPIIAGELLDQIAERQGTTVSQIAIAFLNSPLFESKGQSFTSRQLHYDANRMLKHRKKFEYGDDVQTKFSPLIEKILYVKDTDDGQKKSTEESIDQAAQVLREGLDKFKDPMLAQQMARVFYVNATAFSKSKVDSCFDTALEFCDKAIEMSPNNSFLFDTKGRIYQNKIKVLYNSIREDNRKIEIDAATPVLLLSFHAMKWFQKSLAASVDYQNNYGFHGELSVIFYLLDVLRCVEIFRGQEGKNRLQKYIDDYQVIPAEVETTWSEFHELITDLRNRSNHCIEGLTEDFTIYKGNSIAEKMLPNQIASFKAQYLSYFGKGDEGKGETAKERWLYRWIKINEYLAGDIFSSVFKIGLAETEQESNPRDTLQLLQELAHENYREPVDTQRYKDILLIITTRMALHSPWRTNSKVKPAKLVDEYKEIYKFVDKLFALEESDDISKRLYAHLFKVMFLWPRKELELSDSYCVRDFYDSLEKLRERWERKCKGHFDKDKMLKQTMYKNMSFKKRTRQYTTLFYLGKGSGLDVFVHINELSDKRSLDWESPQVKERLRRLTGIVESRNTIKVKNPLDSSRTIDIYYSSFRQGGFSKEEVSFYLGFSWPHPIALDVKYTKTELGKHPVKVSGSVVDDQVKFVLPKHKVFTYDEYTSNLAKLNKKLAAIEKLKGMKESGEELEKNQEKKLEEEEETRTMLDKLKKSLNSLVALEDDFF